MSLYSPENTAFRALLGIEAELPTMMGAARELWVMKSLRSVPEEVLQRHLNGLRSIVDDLSRSHMQAVFEVNAANLPSFLECSNWLLQLSQRVPEVATELRYLADMFASEFAMGADPSKIE